MNESVDIILPTFARPHTVEYSIRSVLCQTYPDFELHVVGDGCNDATEAVVRSFDDRRVRFYRFPKASGFGYRHRNHVLRRTSGAFVAYMTDDDLWFPDHLERGLQELRDNELALVAFRYAHVRFPNDLDPFFFALDWTLKPLSTFVRNWFMGSVSCVHHRWVFDRVGYWDDKLLRFGDRDFYNRVRRSPLASRYVDRVTVLRFFALHWNHRYGAVERPPQEDYLGKLSDPAWCEAVRSATLSGSRTLDVRRRQCQDFMNFAIHSGPKFLRFLLQKAT